MYFCVCKKNKVGRVLRVPYLGGDKMPQCSWGMHMWKHGLEICVTKTMQCSCLPGKLARCDPQLASGRLRSFFNVAQRWTMRSFFNVAQRWTIQYTCFHIHEIYIYCQLMELLVYSCLFEQCWICSLSAHGIPWILIQ
jgi:hypothetical protein